MDLMNITDKIETILKDRDLLSADEFEAIETMLEAYKKLEKGIYNAIEYIEKYKYTYTDIQFGETIEMEAFDSLAIPSELLNILKGKEG